MGKETCDCDGQGSLSAALDAPPKIVGKRRAGVYGVGEIGGDVAPFQVLRVQRQHRVGMRRKKEIRMKRQVAFGQPAVGALVRHPGVQAAIGGLDADGPEGAQYFNLVRRREPQAAEHQQLVIEQQLPQHPGITFLDPARQLEPEELHAHRRGQWLCLQHLHRPTR